MSKYFDELCRAMTMLGGHPRSVFMGQAVEYEGTAMFRTLRDVPAEKRVELPVAEDMQMGMATGAALAGLLPITIYPRWNFLLLAASQLVLHLDKLHATSGHGPAVIVRVGVGSRYPMDPGIQHVGNYAMPFAQMLDRIPVYELREADEIVPQYTKAAASNGATVLVEFMSEY